jgi:hypothetical protein
LVKSMVVITKSLWRLRVQEKFIQHDPVFAASIRLLDETLLGIGKDSILIVHVLERSHR